MKFTPDKVAFGRHETFPLRYSWLTKGYTEFCENPRVFESFDDATVTLGVGKNMVNSIRYWMQAARLLNRDGKSYESTPLADAVFAQDDGYDPYLEDEGTIWLIHWLIATNPELATGWYWFFNRFHKPEFTGQQVSTALVDFTKQTIKTKVSMTTVRNEAAIILRMYSRTRGTTRTPLEDALDSPLSLLNLVTQNPEGKGFRSLPDDRPSLPLGVVGFALTELLNEMGVRELPLEDLMYARSSYPALGAVFRLTESSLLAKLERLVQTFPRKLELRETAGIHQIYVLEDADPLEYLDFHYFEQHEDAA